MGLFIAVIAQAVLNAADTGSLLLEAGELLGGEANAFLLFLDLVVNRQSSPSECHATVYGFDIPCDFWV